VKIDVTQKLLDLDGEEMQVIIQACPMCGRPAEEKGVRTLRNACTDALTSLFRDEPNLDGTKKFERAVLATKIHGEDEPNLSAEDVVLLKVIIGKRFGPMIILRAYRILDPVSLEE